MKKAVLILFLFVAFPVYADTTISGPISFDTTWSPAGGVYIIDSNFSVLLGVTLTIEPGTIIKARTTALGGPSIYGRLIANGTSELPIRFTSISDDTPGGWQGLYFKPGSEGSFDHVTISYAGYGGFGFGNFVGIENDGGIVAIKNSLIDQNNQHGIWQKAGTLVIENTTISNHMFGLTMWGGAVTATSNSFLSNSQYGLHASGGDSLSLTGNDFTGNARTAYVVASLDFSHVNNTSEDIANRGFETSGEARDGAVWHTSDLPFILNELIVGSGKTLKLSAGTVFKMGPGAYLDVRGFLISNGTADAPIYFTSLKDDSVLGDTNGDGAGSSPNMTDWDGLTFRENSVGNISHSVIKYSGGFNGTGRSAIFNLGGNLLLDNIIFSDNYQSDIYQNAGALTATKIDFSTPYNGLIFDGGTGDISQSKFYALSNAIDNRSGVIIDARHNWWGSVTGPSTPVNPAGTGGSISGSVLYFPWLTSDPLEVTASSHNPVIIVPGIMGSAYKNDELVIDPILHTYDDLIATLDVNGYTPDIDLFTFPYEWRDSNVFSANLLDDKIEEVKEICNCDKVDLVAHSMGGLVARSYIQSFDYDEDIDQVIFLGTPHRGAPTSYLQWEAGKFSPDINVANILIESFFQAEALRNGYSTVFNYIHNRPILSVQELLPVFDYIKDNNTGIIRQYPNDYPPNPFLENLNNNVSSLLSSGVEVTNIVGNSGENKTINVIRVIPTDHAVFWEHGEPEGFGAIIGDSGLERGAGDNTVPQLGSILDGIVNKNTEASHRRIPTVAEGQIFNILTGGIATTTFDHGFELSPKVLLMQLLSPIDFVITAPNGKKIGKNFSNGSEYDEIPDAFYSGFQTGNEYITILDPLDGEYKVEVQGTDNGGEYGILTSYVSEEFATTTETMGITKPDQITDLEVQVNNANPEDIIIERKITLEVLINDINGAYNFGWIKDKKTRDELIKRVEKIYKKDKKIDKGLAKVLSLNLKLYKKDKINEQAYNLIKTDLEWLINN